MLREMTNVVLVVAVMCACTSAAEVGLTLLTDEKALCLDGTPAGYYFQPASSPESQTKWVIYLNGGGECDSEDSCVEATTNKLGSSKYFKSTEDASSWFFASDYCKHNPDFCKFNHLYDPYCSQDLHSGQQTEKNEWGVVFSGHHILTAILDDMDKVGMKDATEILITGASAGGLGVWMNVDYIQKRYPEAKVTGVSIAGLYFYATYYNGVNATGPGTMADFREAAWPNTYALYDAYVDDSCATSQAFIENPAACMLLNNSLPYIESDVFVVQAETDQVVLEGHDCFPGDYMTQKPERDFMTEWHNNMTIALQPFVEQSSGRNERGLGAFAAACYTHTNFTSAYPIIQGLNMYQALHNFYFRTEEGLSQDDYVLIDDCGELCNPTC